MVFCFLGEFLENRCRRCRCHVSLSETHRDMCRNVQKQRDETMEAVRKTMFIIYNVYVDVDKCLPIHVGMNMYEYV